MLVGRGRILNEQMSKNHNSENDAINCTFGKRRFFFETFKKIKIVFE